jgi:DNA-binding NarL/FixJ family response regulator
MSLSSSPERTAVLFDRQPLWLDAVAGVTERIGVEVVARTTRPRDALTALEERRPGVFVTDLDTADATLEGAEYLRRARELHSGLKTIVLTSSDDPSDISGAFAAGAVAYVIKTAHADDIASAIRQAFDHSIFFSPPTVAPAEAMAPSNGAGELTRREFEILKLAADGHSNAQMAKMLWVTEQTVKFHLSNIYRKLDVSNRTEASRWAQLNGLLTVPDSAQANERPNEFGQSP